MLADEQATGGEPLQRVAGDVDRRRAAVEDELGQAAPMAGAVLKPVPEKPQAR